MNEAALAFAAHDTLIDFRVDAVAAAATDVGVASATGGADTETAVEELAVVPLPNSPYVFLPQHFVTFGHDLIRVFTIRCVILRIRIHERAVLICTDMKLFL